MESINSRVIKTADIKWKELKFLQEDNFKELSKESREKLKASMITSKFAMPFFVWEDRKKLYCLDGKHRTLILTELEQEGFNVPEKLPGVHMRCKDKHDAAKLVLLYSSLYAKITDQGLFDFMVKFDFEVEELIPDLDLPYLNLDKFQEMLSKGSFAGSNRELNLDDFTDEMILKLMFNKEDFLFVNEKLSHFRKKMKVETNEEVIKKLLSKNG